MVVDVPWCVRGDFNIIMDPNEKLGGKPHRMYRTLEFQTCINNCGLIDIGYNGSNYTWCNNRRHGKRIWKRLDRIFVNDHWDQLFQRTSIRHLTRTEVVGNPMWILQSKLKALSKRLSQWSRYEIGDINEAVTNWEDKLQELKDIDIEDNSEKSREDVNMAHAQYIRWLSLQESILKQKSQIKWFEEGEKNTRHFHSILIEKRRRQQINRIKNSRGSWIKGDEKITRKAVMTIKCLERPHSKMKSRKQYLASALTAQQDQITSMTPSFRVAGK
ncbi:uncharacterized protein [Nicotiana sylvestris]|uniref:Uncharacterized protein LOC104223235 n=1 Tax=Nicotiana sylvestris TaxID=4096 RepID=A0A1U7WFC3_NICSY|nr:PREDICTED: uncharacterized protein LOC104223235 [Nicotiana sylvestris]